MKIHKYYLPIFSWKSSKIFAIGLLTLAISNDSLVAQCSATVKSDSGSEFPYQHRSNRCEGFYEAQVSAPSIEVVGFYNGQFAFDQKQDEVITISLMREDFSEWNIQAIGIPLDYHYRMDAGFGDGGRLLWSTREVIYPNLIGKKSIGVYAWQKSGNVTYYSPLSVSTKYLNDLSDGGLRLMVRAATSVNEVYWRSGNESWNRINKNYGAGQSVEIQIPSSDEKELIIEIKMKERSSGSWIPKKVYLKL